MFNNSAITESFRQPQQDRSRETLTRILDSATEILEYKNFEELTIAEIVIKADTSVGAFYGRFADKDALLHALDERFLAGFKKRLSERIASKDWEHGTIAYIARDAIGFMVDIYGRDHGLLRSLNMKARIHGDDRFKERERRAWDELYPALEKFLLVHEHLIRHQHPRRAVLFGFQQMFFAMREFLLWEPLRTGQACDTGQLITELTRAYLAYLGIEPADY